MGKKSKFGLYGQILIISFISVFMIGIFTYISEYALSDRAVKTQLEVMAFRISQDIESSVREYPAYRSLLRYWYEHPNDLEIEYDVDYRDGLLTKEKVRILTNHLGSEYNVKYITNEEFRTFSEEDKKLYSEIVYSWLLTRLNSVKKTYNIDYLFCVVTDSEDGPEPFKNQFFLFSAGAKGAKRGTNYEDVYILGKVVSVSDNESQQTVMRDAVKNHNDQVGALATAKNYMDYYDYLDHMGDKIVLIGLTYDLTSIQRSIRREAIISTAYSVFFETVLILFVIFLILSYVIKPLTVVINGINEYKLSKNSDEIKLNLTENMSGRYSHFIRKNEIGLLSTDIIELAEELDNYINQIEHISADKERISIELGLASSIQTEMLPHTFPAFPDRTEFDLYASMNPAKAVGGDFYDYFMLDNDHLVCLIADVSGKGIPAALFMMAAKIIIHNMAIKEVRPSKILELANKEICSNNPLEMFVTAWLGILEISTGKLVASNAGHEYPFIKNGDQDFTLYKDHHGLVMGGLETTRYRDYEIMLKPSSKVFVYTDGLAEANNSNGELYGTARILESLNKNKDKSPKELLESVDKDANTFTEDTEQFDDLTMLCLHYNG